MSKIESVSRAVLEYKEAFNRHDSTGMVNLISDNCAYESADGTDDTVIRGKAEITRYWERLFREMPGIHITGEEIFGLGNRCVLRWRSEWEDETGETRQKRGVDIFEFRNGLIVKQYSYVKGEANS